MGLYKEWEDFRNVQVQVVVEIEVVCWGEQVEEDDNGVSGGFVVFVFSKYGVVSGDGDDDNLYGDQ